jgi:signal transduction histidine kinase
VPVSLGVTAERLPPALEATAYYSVAEALTNGVKHARAGSAQVAAVVNSGMLRLVIRDDGIGGARSNGGSGCWGCANASARRTASRRSTGRLAR